MEIQKNQNQDLSNSLEISKRIRELTCRTVTLTEVFNKVCFEIGIPKSLNPIEMDLLFYHLKKEYPLVRIDDISEAFSKYSSEKLTFKDKGKEINFIEHYGKFDNTFLSRVLNAYQRYVQENNKIIKPTQESFNIIDTNESAEVHYNLVKDFYNIHKDWSLCIGSWNLIYEDLEKRGFIKLSNEEKLEFSELIYEDLKYDYYSKVGARIHVDYELKKFIKEVEDIGYNEWINLKKIKNSILAFECKKRLVQIHIERELNN